MYKVLLLHYEVSVNCSTLGSTLIYLTLASNGGRI